MGIPHTKRQGNSLGLKAEAYQDKSQLITKIKKWDLLENLKCLAKRVTQVLLRLFQGGRKMCYKTGAEELESWRARYMILEAKGGRYGKVPDIFRALDCCFV